MNSIFPNLSVAQEFLSNYLNGEKRTCFQVFKNSESCSVRPGWKYGTFEELKPWLVKQNKLGCGIYFAANRTDGRGRAANNIVAVSSVFVDLDNAPVEPVAECEAPPHIITVSSPGRHQAFWRVSDVELYEFGPIQRALAKRFNGDPAVSDLARVMRLPGFYHLKSEPFECKIHTINRHEPWSKDQLISLLKLDIQDGERLWEPTGSVDDEAAIPKGQRHRVMITIAARLRNAGMAGERLYDALWKENLARCKPPLPQQEIAQIAKWGLSKQAGIVRPANSMQLTDNSYQPRRKKPEGRIMSLPELVNTDYPPTKWIVCDLLPEGLTIVAGRPKVGKSWLVLAISIAIANGEKALGQFQANQGQVLSLSLEDTPQRFRARSLTILGGKPAPENLQFTETWTRLPDCTRQIAEWVEAQAAPRLVVIDTFTKIRPRDDGVGCGVYERDYRDVGDLQLLARQYGIAIVLIHHQRKADSEDDYDSVSGSAGLTGAADTVWILERKDRSKMQGNLIISGRDIGDRKYALRWKQEMGLWLYAGDSDAIELTMAQQKVLTALKELDVPSSPTELASILGISRQAAWTALYSLVKSGLAEKSVRQGKYLLTPMGNGFENAPF